MEINHQKKIITRIGRIALLFKRKPYFNTFIQGKNFISNGEWMLAEGHFSARVESAVKKKLFTATNKKKIGKRIEEILIGNFNEFKLSSFCVEGNALIYSIKTKDWYYCNTLYIEFILSCFPKYFSTKNKSLNSLKIIENNNKQVFFLSVLHEDTNFPAFAVTIKKLKRSNFFQSLRKTDISFLQEIEENIK